MKNSWCENLWNRDSPSPEPSAAPTDPREWTRTSASTTSSREWMSCAGTFGCLKKKSKKTTYEKVQKMCERISGCCAGFPHVDGGLSWAAPQDAHRRRMSRSKVRKDASGAATRQGRGDAARCAQNCRTHTWPHGRDVVINMTFNAV